MRLDRFPSEAIATAAFCGLAFCSPGLPAQEGPATVRIVDSIDESKLIALTGNTPPAARAEFDRGRVSPDLAMGDLVLVLRRGPERQAAFDSFVRSQQEPASPNFHQWLAPEEVGERFGPAQSDVDALENWLREHGFSIDEVGNDRLSIRFSGMAAQVESTFHVEMHNLDVKGEKHISNMSDPRIPAALVPVVAGVKALHNFFPRPLHRLGKAVVFDSKGGGWRRVGGDAGVQFQPLSKRGVRGERGEFTTVNGYGDTLEDVAPYDFAKIYNVLPLWQAAQPIDGAGQTIAIAGTSNVVPADIAAFRKAFGLPVNAPKVIVTNSDPGTCQSLDSSCLGDLIENSLDVEWSGAVAKGAQIVLVTSSAATPSTDALYLSESYAVSHKTAPILNVSYGSCETALGTTGNIEYNNLWQTAAAEGIAVFVAAGDAGSAGCDQGFDAIYGVPYGAQFGKQVSGITSTIYDTSVGGTDFNWGSAAAPYWSGTDSATTGASALGYVPEVPWNSTCANPLIWPGLAADAAYLDAPPVTDGDSACNFVVDNWQTILQNYGLDIAWLSDTVGGGGGASLCTVSYQADPMTCQDGYAKPAWQTGVPGIPADGRRDVPDVSFFASNGFLGSAYLICVSAGGNACSYSAAEEPSAQEVGGTSVASPAMAGVMALINQKAGAAQGSPNKVLYELAARQSWPACKAESAKTTGSCYFNDVDTGGNATPCINTDWECNAETPTEAVGVLGAYAAGLGYDQATGLGSLNVANVVNAWPLATAPVATLNVTSLTFAATTVGHAAATQTVVLRNNGKTALILNGTGDGIRIAGANASSFAETNTCGTSLASAAVCAITVSFKPAAAGALSASVTIADNAFPSPQTVTLTGTGLAPAPSAVLSAQSVSFSTIVVGGVSTILGTLSNSGTAALSLSGAGQGISITGTGAAQFSQTNTCGTSVAAGASCNISINFKPTASGAFTASLNVTDNAAGSPQKVALSGTATTVALTSNVMFFPSTTVGATAVKQSTTLTNKGTAALALNGTGQGIKIAGTNASSFSQTNTCGTSVAAGASCVITVSFKPAAAGSLTAVVDITDGAYASPQTVGLNGTGAAAGAPKSNRPNGPKRPIGGPSGPPKAATAQVMENYGKLPLRFEDNRGQTDQSVQFLARGPGYQLFLAGKEAVMTLPDRRGKSQSVRMALAGGNPGAQVKGEDRLPGVSNYFLSSDPASAHTNVPAFARVRYADVYPGVDLVYYGNQRQLEYDFAVAPGADPAPIRFRFAATDRLSLDRRGNLVIAAGDAAVAFHKPVVYQPENGARHKVAGRFKLLADNSVGFALGRYNHTEPLVIDPTLVYSTLLGGSNEDLMAAMALDANGNAYITGYTISTDYPVTTGAYQTTFSTAFVTKLNPSGTALVYSTFLGAGAAGTAIAVDKSGNAYVTGTTSSTKFPVTAGVLQTKDNASSGAPTGFVAKLNAAGTALVYSTYLGGNISDNPNSLAIDSAGDVYVAGATESTSFPVTAGVFQSKNNSAAEYGWNAFIAKINPAATALLYSTYLGGSTEYGGETPILVAIDASGDAYVSGTAISTDFPVTAGVYQPKNNATPGQSDLTLTELNPTATKLIYSTYLGESGNSYGSDVAYGLAVDSAGNAYLAGQTWETNYPVTSGAFQKATKGGVGVSNGFVTKMNAKGTALVYSTYLGGTGNPYGDAVKGLALDSAGDVYLTGITGSTDFPVTPNAYQAANNAAFYNGQNAFLTELNPAGSALIYSTYFGGEGQTDTGTQIALGPNSQVYVVGTAGSPNFPVTANAYKTVFNSQNFATGFVLDFAFGAAPGAPTLTSLLSNANPAVLGTNMVFSATVTPVSGTAIPTGNIVFSIDLVNKATVPLSAAGFATFSTGPLTVGKHTVQASYQGSTKFAASSFGLTETITPAIPVIAPAGGVYPAAQMVAISDATAGTTIYYTTDGTAPTTSSTVYKAPFLVALSTTVRAIASLSGLPATELASASYTLVNAPSALAAPATAIATPSATLNGWVNGEGMAGYWYFRYGTSASALTTYTPRTTLPGSVLGSVLSIVPVAVKAPVTGLKTKATYYYQVVVSTSAGTSDGAVLSFTTN